MAFLVVLSVAGAAVTRGPEQAAPVEQGSRAVADPGEATFDRAWLEQEARRLAEQAHVEVEHPLPDRLAKLGYDEYRSIRIRPQGRLWYGEQLGFSIDLLPPGFLFDAPVEVNVVVDGKAMPIAFDASRFDFGAMTEVTQNAPDLFYSGFRVRYPLNRPDVDDEFLVFQGASYFRAVGRGGIYGLSARGLSVKTADPKGEEFPRFTRFWIERPAPDARDLTIHALLDGPSVSGAYTFTVTPGEATIVEVDAALYPRADLAKVGVATQTSMFLFDATNRSGFDDYRRAVHDSNGLQMLTGEGLRLWRPLANPATVQVSAFLDHDPNGFGLAQRARQFEDYQDAEARYHRRPSLWVEPLGEWGEGAVELVEIPTDTEYNDNIVALWQPARPLEAGRRHHFRYRMFWSDLPPDDAPLARVSATRIGAAAQDGTWLFVVDFLGGDNAVKPLPEMTSTAGRVSNVTTQTIDQTRLERVTFEFDPENEKLAELRLVLHAGDSAWSETWLYRWQR